MTDGIQIPVTLRVYAYVSISAYSTRTSPHLLYVSEVHDRFTIPDEIFYFLLCTADRLCALVVRVPGYRSRGHGSNSRHYQIF
jgi:hypothetical protein